MIRLACLLWSGLTVCSAVVGAQSDATFQPDVQTGLLLHLDGDAGDAVSAVGWGTTVGNVTHGGITYDVYNQGLYAQLLVNHALPPLG